VGRFFLICARRGFRTGRCTGEALGREWQRLMPNPKLMPITRVEGDTAYGEIRVHCPLRGSGDVHACHRLMSYDRALMRPAVRASSCSRVRQSRASSAAESRSAPPTCLPTTSYPPWNASARIRVGMGRAALLEQLLRQTLANEVDRPVHAAQQRHEAGEVRW
jgi:hypothetical protein